MRAEDPLWRDVVWIFVRRLGQRVAIDHEQVGIAVEVRVEEGRSPTLQRAAGGTAQVRREHASDKVPF